MKVASMKKDRFCPNFLSNGISKRPACVSVTIIISKLLSNEHALPAGALVSCFFQPDVNLFFEERKALIKE